MRFGGDARSPCATSHARSRRARVRRARRVGPRRVTLARGRRRPGRARRDRHAHTRSPASSRSRSSASSSVTIRSISPSRIVRMFPKLVDAVIGDAVLGKVVGANLLRAIAGADLAAAQRTHRFLRLAALVIEEHRAQHLHRPLAILQLRALLLHETTTPVGRCVMRIALSVLLTCWPPAPELYTCRFARSLGSISTSTSSSSACGSTATVAVLVWTRPWASVTGTRCTR